MSLTPLRLPRRPCCARNCGRRFGLDESEPRERVRQIELAALRKLRHPTRVGRLRAFVG
jgi:DNA-directed RNA polymerase sigma subunit (sigma70/sigma32)